MSGRPDIKYVPSNWGLAPKFGADDLLYSGPVDKPKVSRSDRARALGVPTAMLTARYSDKQVENLSAHKWSQYRKVLRSRGQHSEVTRLSNRRRIADEKRKCPGQWNPKTGCRKRKWYNEARDAGQHALHTVASSPITQGALAVAAFTPLAPIAVPAGAALAAADRLAQGESLDVKGLSSVAASAIGVPPGAVPVATELGDMALTGKLDAQGLGEAAASAVGVPAGAVKVASHAARGDLEGVGRAAVSELGVPPGAVKVASQVARGDVEGLGRAAASELGVPEGAVKVASQVARGDVEGLGRAAASELGVPPGAVKVVSQATHGDVRGLSRAAAAEIGVPEGAKPIARQVSRTAKQAKAAKKRAQRAAKAASRAAKKARRDTLRASRGGVSPLPTTAAASSLLRMRY